MQHLRGLASQQLRSLVPTSVSRPTVTPRAALSVVSMCTPQQALWTNALGHRPFVAASLSVGAACIVQRPLFHCACCCCCNTHCCCWTTHRCSQAAQAAVLLSTALLPSPARASNLGGAASSPVRGGARTMATAGNGAGVPAGQELAVLVRACVAGSAGRAGNRFRCRQQSVRGGVGCRATCTHLCPLNRPAVASTCLWHDASHTLQGGGCFWCLEACYAQVHSECPAAGLAAGH